MKTKIKEGKKYLTEIPHEKGKITFQYPAFGGCGRNVTEVIDKWSLKRPTSSETASLVYDAFQNPRGEYESEIIEILSDTWFWEFTGNFYLPKSNEEINNGVILEHNPEIENRRLIMNKKSLIKKLQENDSNVKFVPFGFKIREQSIQELQENPYIVARYGEEGAEKIAEIASKYKSNPKLLIFNSVDEGKARMSTLTRSFFGGGLIVDGEVWKGLDVGHAFGVYNYKKR